MPDSKKRVVSRRVVLGGAAAGVAGSWLVPPGASWAGEKFPDTRIDAVASRWDRRLIELRRDLHRHPEPSGEERRTADVVARWLRAAGLTVTTGVGGHGVVGVLTGARPGRTVAYRADMDAVLPNGQLGGGPDTAHVCGHDLHTTIGVGVAVVLARLRERLAGRVMFVFQPAEESLAGAAAMLADGVFDRVRPAEIHALHCGPWPVGKIMVMPGKGMPGLDRGSISLTGPDALARAERLADGINALGTVARPLTPADSERFVADLETPHGPLERFVVTSADATESAGGAEVRVSSRCWPLDRYTEVREAVGRLAESVGAASVAFPEAPFPGLATPERDARRLQQYLRRTVGPDRTGTLYASIPFNGEDFGLFLGRMPGTYSFLGVRTPGAGIMTSYPHVGTFDPDERAIGYGVRAMAGWLAERAGGH